MFCRAVVWLPKHSETLAKATATELVIGVSIAIVAMLLLGLLTYLLITRD